MDYFVFKMCFKFKNYFGVFFIYIMKILDNELYEIFIIFCLKIFCGVFLFCSNEICYFDIVIGIYSDIC